MFLEFLKANAATIIVALALAAIVASIVVRLVKSKKAGRSSCGCNCGNCPMSESCHGK